MPKYSFIVPVYKAERYLADCMNSVLAQTYNDYEIVLVDDGSPDRCGELCDEYEASYKNILVIHQANQGASVARNTGLNNCNGEYVIFLDSDDYWDDAEGLWKIDRLFEEGADVVIFTAKGFKERTQTISLDRYYYPVEVLHTLNSEDCLSYLISNDNFNIHPGKRAYRKSFLLNHGISFKPHIKSEDIDMGIRVANALPKYRFLNEYLYVYRHHDGSVTHSVDAKHLQNYLDIIKEFAEFEYTSLQIKNDILSYLAYQLALLMAYVEYVNPENKKYFLKETSKLTFLFRYTNYPRTKKIAKFYKCFGLFFTRKFLGMYLKRRF